MYNNLNKTLRKLLIRIAKGDKNALYELENSLSTIINHYVKVYLQKDLFFDDVVANVYLKIVQNANKFCTSRESLPLIIEIIKNLCIDQNRKDILRQTEEFNEDTYQAVSNQCEVGSFYWIAMRCINEKERQILECRLIYKMSFVEMGKKFNQSKSLMFKKYNQILDKLRNLYEEWTHEN